MPTSTSPEKPENQRVFTACLIVIGNEILSGRTQDSNLAYLATWLNQLGVRLLEARVIPDIEAAIVETVNALRPKFDYVFTTGGIGPTHDDITAASIARAFGVPLELRDEAVALLKDHYGADGLSNARLRMAHTPAGAELIENPISRAPGFRVENVFVLAGVPVIMQAMLESVKHRIAGGPPVRSKSVSAYVSESAVASEVADVQDRHRSVDIGSYPFYRKGKPGTTLVARSTDESALDAAIAELAHALRRKGGDPKPGDSPD